MLGGLYRFALIAYMIGFAGCRAAKLEGFASPKISIKSPIAQTQEKAAFNLSVHNSVDKTPLELKDAVIWHAPSAKYLSKKFTEAEMKEIDTQAMEILLMGLNLTNPDFAEAHKHASKNRIVLKLADIIEASNNQSISQVGQYINKTKAEADNYLRKVLSQTYHEYALAKKLFEARTSRDPKYLKQSLEARSRLSYLCGIEAVEQVENLWRRI